MQLEDILDDAQRYLRDQMSLQERQAFERLLEQHPTVREELLMMQLVQRGFEKLDAAPPPRNRGISKRLFLLGLLIVFGVVMLRYCWRLQPSDSPPIDSSMVPTILPEPIVDTVPVIRSTGGRATHQLADRGLGAAWGVGGDLLLTGIYTGNVRFDTFELSSPDTIQMQIFLASYNLWQRSFVWVRPIHGTGALKMTTALAIEDQGNIIATGGFGQEIDFGQGPIRALGSANDGQGDLFVAKFDPYGKILHSFHTGGNRIANRETGTNFAHSVTTDRWRNEIIVCGSYIGQPLFGDELLPQGGPNEDLFVAKYDADLRLQWVQTATGTYMVEAFDVATDADGNIFVTGYFGHHNLGGSAFFGTDTLTTFGGRDIFLAKYSPQGELQWVRQAGGTKAKNGMDYGYSVAADREGNAIITGFFEGTGQFGPFRIHSVGSRDLFLAKYSSAGEVLWVQRAGGYDNPKGAGDIGKSLSLDQDGNIYLTGNISDGADFSAHLRFRTNGWEDAFLAKYSPGGRALWVRTWGGEFNEFDTDAGLCVDTSPNGMSVVTGYFTGTLHLGPATIRSSGREDIFIAVFDADGKLVFVKRWAYV